MNESIFSMEYIMNHECFRLFRIGEYFTNFVCVLVKTPVKTSNGNI